VASPEKNRSVPRLGLRGRLIAAFATGALVLSVSMGAIAYYTTRHFLITDRQSAALHQAYANAALLRNALAANVPHIDLQVTSLDSGAGSVSLLNDNGQWFSTSLAVGKNSLPLALRQSVGSLHVATQTSVINDAPAFSVGVPLPSQQAAYYLVYDLSDLQHTLRVLLTALGAAAAATTLLGAGLGLIASRRTMRPLAEVSLAAVAIAQGDLETRLPGHRGDADLEGLTNSFNAMVDQLQERLERDARFTSDVSHELRSPLTTMATTLGVLESRRGELSEHGKQALDLMSADIRRFARLVEDLLEISRSDAGASDMIYDTVTIGELVEQSLHASTRLSEDFPPPTLFIDPSVRSIRLMVDKRRFERIMGNLIENAANYAGGATRVSATLSHDALHLELRVGDEGPGISLVERDRIFERFYRGDISGQREGSEGSGLGLALVADNVARHGGTVRVEQGPNAKGSDFVVMIPLHREIEDAHET